MKKLLLTGAGGLIGSHLLPLLTEEYETYTISTKYNNKNNFKIDFAKDWDIELLPGNLDTIIHLAQSANFRDFPDKATQIFNINTNSTLKLIDFAFKTGVKTFIFASSGGIYGNSKHEFNETTDIVYKGEMGFYLATKQCSEIILDNYSKLLQVIQLRMFFVYGKGQRKDMLIPRLVETIKQGKPVYLQGPSGIAINPTHVEDAVKSIKASLSLTSSDKINIAGPEVLTIKELSEIIGNVIGKEPQFVSEEKKVDDLIGNINNMKKKLNKPIIKFKEGIKDLI
jgi:nucleoside-diphosphate-sugar epimerase